jgi:hypothetical protein
MEGAVREFRISEKEEGRVGQSDEEGAVPRK